MALFLLSGHENANIYVWDVTSGLQQESLVGHRGPVVALASLPDAEELISGGGNSLIRRWNIASSTATVTFPSTTSLDPDWSHDGRYFALPLGDAFAGSVPPGLAIWDMQEKAMVAENFTSKFDLIWGQVSYSPDDKLLLLRGIKNIWPNVLPEGLNALVIDATNGELITSFTSDDDENWFRSVVWSPDGSQVAGAKINGEIHIWDYETGELIISLLHEEESFLIDANWSPDGSKFGSSSDDGTVMVWDAITWEPLFSPIGHASGVHIGAVVWSPDSSRLLTVSGNDETGATDTTARIWDAETGEELLNIADHTRMVSWGDWSPDGSRIVTASHDDTTRIWDATTGDELLVLDTPNMFLPYANWSPDGKYLAVNGWGQQAEIWRVWQSTEELLAYTQTCCVIRALTLLEREQFGLLADE